MSRPTRRRARIEPDGSVLRWPGARAKFALLGEVLWTGVLMAIASVLIVTWPAAVAAGVSHLRRFLHAEATPASAFFRDVWKALPGGIVVGAASALLGALVVVDLALAAGGAIPGGVPAAIVAALIGLAALLLTVAAASSWTPSARWLDLLRQAPRVLADDVSGAAFIVAALGLAAVISWQFLPLAIPVLGLVAFALVVIAERRLVRAGTDAA